MTSDALMRQHRPTYDALASEYEARAASRLDIARDRVARLASFLPYSCKVLDVGCGVGSTLLCLDRAGYATVGIDLSPCMADYARARAKRALVYVGDVLEMQADGAFDAVIADAFIHLFPTNICAAILTKLRKLARPGGVVSLSTTVHRLENEGWQTKGDYPHSHQRYRTEWTPGGFYHLLCRAQLPPLNTYMIKDHFGKVWMVANCQNRSGLDVE